MTEPCEEVKRVEQRYEKALDDMEKHYKGVLDKIRAEIESKEMIETTSEREFYNMALNDVLQIIDKYRVESEVESCK